MPTKAKSFTSERKKAANRANARHSTGPKSILGKSKSKLNAAKHGVYAASSLLLGEDEDLYEAIKKEQRKIFRPKTYIEKALVGQLVSELWMLRRLARAEYAHFADVQGSAKDEVRERLKPAELEFLKFGAKLDEQSSTDVQQKMVVKLRKKTEKLNLDRTFESLFVFDGEGRAQRLLSMKRHVIQTILGIERELDRRSVKGTDFNSTS